MTSMPPSEFNGANDPLKVGVINFHFAHNHGAVLQAVALHDRLRSLGCESITIDYQPKGHAQQYAVRPNPMPSAAWKYRGSRSAGLGIAASVRNAVKRAAHAVTEWRRIAERGERARLFSQYLERHFVVTRRYTSYRSLRRNPPRADLYLSGSDQVWNPVNTGGLDPAYFLGFAPDGSIAATYAASPCELDVELHSKELRCYLPRIDYVGLRESDLVTEMSALAGRSVAVTPDPVLLMRPVDFQAYREEAEVPERPYIALYAVRTKATIPIVEALVLDLVERHGFEIMDLSLDPSPWNFSVHRPGSLTPGTFVSIIAKSSYVVSNSFHATAFAVLYERQFLVATQEGTAQRLGELLGRLDLASRAHSAIPSEGVADSVIDYDAIRPKLDKMREEGMGYLARVVAAARERRDAQAR